MHVVTVNGTDYPYVICPSTGELIMFCEGARHLHRLVDELEESNVVILDSMASQYPCAERVLTS